MTTKHHILPVTSTINLSWNWSVVEEKTMQSHLVMLFVIIGLDIPCRWHCVETTVTWPIYMSILTRLCQYMDGYYHACSWAHDDTDLRQHFQIFPVQKMLLQHTKDVETIPERLNSKWPRLS